MTKVGEIRVHAECGAVVKDVLWVSLQGDRDQSVSIGFSGDDFIMSGFTEVRGQEKTYVDLAAKHDRETITGPHITLHRPYFHIRSKKHQPLFEGLVWTDPDPSMVKLRGYGSSRRRCVTFDP